MADKKPESRKSALPGARAVGFRVPNARKPGEANGIDSANGPAGTSGATSGENGTNGSDANIAAKPANGNSQLATSIMKPVAASLPQSPATKPSASTTARSAPPKKRAKGNGFFGVLFFCVFAVSGYAVWTSFLQFQAYGVIDGRVISVSAPWDGNIENWQVREGELVEQGQVVATMSNLDREHQLAALGDQLKMSQAQLDAEMSRIQFDVNDHDDRSQKSMAEYLQASGELASEKARFRESDRQLERAGRLLKSKNISKAAYEKLFYEFEARKQKIEKLSQAVEVLRDLSETSAARKSNGSPQLKPLLAKIEQTQSEMERLRERIDQGQIKSPVSGRITKRIALTGETVKERETVVEILEDNSIEAILYVPQSITDEFEIGKQVSILLEPHHQPLTCTVRRLGDRFEPAPESIERYYQSQQYLLPVYLTPDSEYNQLLALRIHGTVKRPYEWGKTLVRLRESIERKYAEVAQGNKS